MARYIRVEATTLRPNPADGGRYAMQFAEFEAYGPEQPIKVQSSLNPAVGFFDDAGAVIDLSRDLIVTPLIGPSRFFRLSGNPSPMITASWIDNGNFIIQIQTRP